MRMLDPWLVSGGLVLMMCSYASSAAAAPRPAPVIAPGNEALVSDMLGEGAALPEHCIFDGASIERTYVSARYKCATAGDVVVELHHPDDAASDATRTARFAIVPRPGTPPALVDAVQERIRQREQRWHWTVVEPGSGAALGPTPTPAGAGLTPTQASAFATGVAAYRAGRFADALATFEALTRQQPNHDVLGMLVASLVEAGLDPAHVARWNAAADAAPTDPVPQLIAGMGAFFCGQLRGRTHAEKSELYRMALRYLARSGPDYAAQPRVVAALALSHFRLGERSTAEPLIEQAVAAAPADADLYVARAEIFVERDPARARRDLQTNLDLVARDPSISAEQKTRARALLDALTTAGRAPNAAEVFDPPAGPPAHAATAPPQTARSSAHLFALGALLVATLAAAAALVVRRRRRAHAT